VARSTKYIITDVTTPRLSFSKLLQVVEKKWRPKAALVGTKSLFGNITTDFCVARAIDFAHPAFAYFREDAY
jgi:hypothetical protein